MEFDTISVAWLSWGKGGEEEQLKYEAGARPCEKAQRATKEKTRASRKRRGHRLRKLLLATRPELPVVPFHAHHQMQNMMTLKSER